MAETLKAIVIDALTGEVTERPFTAEELEQRELMFAEAEELQAQADAKAAARTSALAKLAALGLTADEVAAL
jgi:hypothetical protein